MRSDFSLNRLVAPIIGVWCDDPITRKHIITMLSNYVLHWFWLVLVVLYYNVFVGQKFFWCPCMAINI